MLGMFLMTVAERYHRVMDWIEQEQHRATAANERLSFQLGDLNCGTNHLHTRDCLGGFVVNLDPLEWRKLTKRVVRDEVRGTEVTRCSSFIGLLDALVARQRQWHVNLPPTDMPRNVLMTSNNSPIELVEKDATCLRLAREARSLIEKIDYE